MGGINKKYLSNKEVDTDWHYQKLTMGIPNEEKPQRDRGITAVETFLQAVDRACIVFNLKTGTIIIGIINIILCLTFAVKYMVLLVSLVNDVAELLDRMKQEPHESDGATLGFSIRGSFEEEITHHAN